MAGCIIHEIEMVRLGIQDEGLSKSVPNQPSRCVHVGVAFLVSKSTVQLDASDSLFFSPFYQTCVYACNRRIKYHL